MPVIGIRTIARKWFYRAFVAGKMRMCCFTEVVQHTLHSTKGWRPLRRKRQNIAEHDWRKLPAREETFDWAPGFPDKRGVGAILGEQESILRPDAMLRAQMRHRERRRDIQRAQTKAAWLGIDMAEKHPTPRADALRAHIQATGHRIKEETSTALMSEVAKMHKHGALL